MGELSTLDQSNSIGAIRRLSICFPTEIVTAKSLPGCITFRREQRN